MVSETSYTRPLSSVSKRWFVLRHGHSKANAEHVIASQLGTARDAYGLTHQGQQDVEKSVPKTLDILREDGPPLLLCSPLLRTRETAAIAGRYLGVEPQIDERLCERNFGDLELLDDSHYEKVWELDVKTPTQIPWQVETVYEVTERIVQLIVEVEKTQEANTCMLVTHCDTAMILSCAFHNIDPRHHRALEPLKTAEIRQLDWVHGMLDP